MKSVLFIKKLEIFHPTLLEYRTLNHQILKTCLVLVELIQDQPPTNIPPNQQYRHFFFSLKFALLSDLYCFIEEVNQSLFTYLKVYNRMKHQLFEPIPFNIFNPQYRIFKDFLPMTFDNFYRKLFLFCKQIN